MATPVPWPDPRWQVARMLDATRMDYPWTVEQWSNPGEWDRLFVAPGVMALLRLGPWDASAHLLKIAVALENEGQGLARILWKEVEAWLRSESYVSVHLEVRADNVRAVRLYEGLGFKSQRRVRAYYGDGSDALIFQKALSSSI